MTANDQASQLERLARPIPPKYVKPPAQGKFGSYVPHDVVTQILLTIHGPYGFEVGEIFTGENGWIEGCLVTLVLTIDGRSVRITEVGDCENPGNWKSQGGRMKDAISDGIKRAAMRVGLGLHLRDEADYFLYKQLVAAREGANGKVPDPAPAPEKVTTTEVPSVGSSHSGESSGSDEGGGAAAVGTAAAPSSDIEAEHDWLPKGPRAGAPPAEPLPRNWPATPLLDTSPPAGPVPARAPEPERKSTAQQRRTAGMSFRELVANGIVLERDKKELVGILTRDRVTSMADTTYEEANKVVAAIRFLESGDIAFRDDPAVPGDRGLVFATQRGQDFLRPWLVDPNEEPPNPESDRQTCDECGRTWVGGDTENHTPGCPNGVD